MSKRIQLHEQIIFLTRQIAEINADMAQRNDLSMLDIDLLRKHTIDLYEQVNQLRLVMKEDVEIVRQETIVESEERRAENEVAKGEDQRAEDEETSVEQETEPVSLSQIPMRELSGSEAEDQGRVQNEELSAESELETEMEVEEIPEVKEEISVESKYSSEEEKPIAKSQKLVADEEPNDLASKFSNTPISDLKQAISIAKKFELINSLFGGDVQKYALTIHHINNMNSGDDAFSHLHKLKDEHKWDEEDKNFTELANLVRRRFLG